MRAHLLIAALICCHTFVGFGQDYSADQPPFSAEPQALLKAFSNVQADSNPVTVLLEDMHFEFDSQGLQTYRNHLILKIWNKTGAEDWAVIQEPWEPWLQERPIVRARVIAHDGTMRELDPKTIAESPVGGGDQTLSDRRMVKAPLPAIEPGSVVEEEIVVRQTAQSPVPGTAAHFIFGNSVPVLRTRLEIRGPETIPFRFKTLLLPEVKVSDRKENGTRVITFDQGSTKAWDDPPALLPSNEPRYPAVDFSTAPDWHSIAAGYSAVVERQLKGFDAAPHLPTFGRDVTREAKILAIVDQLNREIRYTGIEFSEASVIPRTPDEVLARKYGDCKDKSVLAVALLRAAGIEAHIALLSATWGKDVEPDLPGMGEFNHAIVYVPGKPDIWLDPTDPDLRVGVISPENQGRLALIARPETSALLRIPELTAQDNRVVETREFKLAELGRAKVIETSETWGTPDRAYRADFGDLDPKALRDHLKSYVEWTYAEAKLGSVSHGEETDLTRPFQLKVELDDAQRGTTLRTEAAVAIRVAQLTNRLPEFFREEPEEEKKQDKPAEPRTRDFAISEPYTYEWHYIITAPAGFRIRQFPEPSDEAIGIASLSSKFTRQDDTTVLGDFRFVMAKRRFSAAEGFALRDAILKLAKRDMVMVYFDQIGETALASGKVKEALAEFAALRRLHPKEALHAMQTARALLAAGAGTTARVEARQAAALEPESAEVYTELAEVLTHDLVGREMAKGFDLNGAVAAYRKALELKTDDITRLNLAILLEYDRDAERYAPGADLEASLAEYRKILDKLPKLGAPNNYAIALLRAGKIRELKDYLAGAPENEQTPVLRICADALLNGADAGIRQAANVSGFQKRQEALASAGQTLMQLRKYDLAADVLNSIASSAPNSAGVTTLIQMLRKTKRLEEVAATIKQPEDAVLAISARLFNRNSNEQEVTEMLSSYAKDFEKVDLAKLRSSLGASGNIRKAGITLETAVELGLSAVQLVREGDDEHGWVVRLGMPGSAGENQAWLVVREGQQYRLIAPPGEFEGVARLVMDLAGEGKTAQARIWLDRIRQETPAGSGDDPLSSPIFSRVWQEGQDGDVRAVRTAAALLIADKPRAIESTVAILEDARKTSEAPMAQYLTVGLIEAYQTAKQYDKALALAEPLVRTLPRSANAWWLAARAAYSAGGKREADRIINASIGGFKNNVVALRLIGHLAMSFGDTERSIAMFMQITDSGRAQPEDFNSLAWSYVMADKVTEATLENGKRGMLGKTADTALIHTIACVQVELGQTAEARAAMLQRMEEMGQQEPDDDEWYVFGRIAEKYDLSAEAIAMYKRLTKPANERSIPSSSYALAQRRLKALGAL